MGSTVSKLMTFDTLHNNFLTEKLEHFMVVVSEHFGVTIIYMN